MLQQKAWLCRILSVITVLTLILSVAVLPQPAAAEDDMEIVDSYPYTTVTRVKVNLRASRSVRSALLKKIPQGAEISVFSTKGDWAEVTYGQTSGWVKSEFIVLKKVQKIKVTPTPTPAPTLSPEEDAGHYNILRVGSSGSEVRALQEALIELGFLSGQADGQFGTGTENAVIAFQRANSYPDTGLMDANIQAFLYSGTPKNAQGTATKIKTLSPVPGTIMKQGNRGEAVGKLQERLKALGFYNGEATCNYDTATKSAVQAFQKKNGLKADGVAGAETQKVIYSDTALSANSTPTPAPIPAPTPTPKPTAAPTYKVPNDTVKLGSKGTDAKTVQRRLRDLGYYTGKIDGEFGKASVEALKRFQAANGLTDDGKAGKTTYNILFSSKAKTAAEAEATPTPEATQTTEPEATPDPTEPASTTSVWNTLRRGMEGQEVSQLQEALIALGYLAGKPTGGYSDETFAAVKAFQKMNGLTADGVAGEATQKLLYSGNAKPAESKATATPAPTSTTGTLKEGDRGEEVKIIQKILIDLGFLSGKADGVFGKKTTEAVTAFQKVNKLLADGIAGAKTLAKLKSSSASPAPTKAPAVLSGTFQQGDKGDGVKLLQEKLIELGYLSGKADGIFGKKTTEAVAAFQKAYNLKADGVAGSKTIAKLKSVSPTPTPTPAPQATVPPTILTGRPTASQVLYANWYTTVKSVCRSYPYVTVYDFQTGISWQVHIFSLGAHADCEPLTANDTAKMEKVFGGNTWNPRAVWVVFANGSVYMASTHSNPHGTQHITDNNFGGHMCIHFPRTQEQVTAIGPYATSHQETIDKGWALTQSMK